MATWGTPTEPNGIEPMRTPPTFSECLQLAFGSMAIVAIVALLSVAAASVHIRDHIDALTAGDRVCQQVFITGLAIVMAAATLAWFAILAL